LEGYQEEKDNPRKQVVYMKAEELYDAFFARRESTTLTDNGYLDSRIASSR
jgi:hypothetical protein